MKRSLNKDSGKAHEAIDRLRGRKLGIVGLGRIGKKDCAPSGGALAGAGLDVLPGSCRCG